MALILTAVIGLFLLGKLAANTDSDVRPSPTTVASPAVSSSKSVAVPSHAVVLLYHHVDDTTPALTSISPQKFIQQLDYLTANDFQVWPLDKIIRYLKSAKPIPDKTVAITFDDSYQSVYHTAFPLLRQRHWPFTVFVSTDDVDHGYNLQSSWQQLREMAKHGATIANHSSGHLHLLKKLAGESEAEWLQRIKQDIENAEQRIIEQIGSSKKLFAYPYGEYNQALTELVSSMGYTGFGQQSGAIGEHSDFSSLPRFPFAGNYTELESFALKVLTLPMPVKASAADKPLRHATDKPPLTLRLINPLPQPQSLQCFASLQGKMLLQWLADDELRITPESAIPVGRSRYNCTALFSGGDDDDTARYFWHSTPWIRLDSNEQWLPD
jgi:peptidoglycan/xylan/chitin deacetylase (PgdA/CDA1 family)